MVPKEILNYSADWRDDNDNILLTNPSSEIVNDNEISVKRTKKRKNITHETKDLKSKKICLERNKKRKKNEENFEDKEEIKKRRVGNLITKDTTDNEEENDYDILKIRINDEKETSFFETIKSVKNFLAKKFFTETYNETTETYNLKDESYLHQNYQKIENIEKKLISKKARFSNKEQKNKERYLELTTIRDQWLKLDTKNEKTPEGKEIFEVYKQHSDVYYEKVRKISNLNEKIILLERQIIEIKEKCNLYKKQQEHQSKIEIFPAFNSKLWK
ncbi:hypothetical protein [endosymbiont GvMRE of Glomus versiforme]|uniref:hypothetical protein n=1 Tax=endosymbiont GvMRE of Glomus versiforme TaxID=2039283 RepID=UPI0011C3CE1F|nr:hypothetical protein [endosymbiont GvMRE of Glomus versiforme]